MADVRPPVRPPHEWGSEHERAVLALLLGAEPGRFAELRRTVLAEDFGSPKYRAIWQAMERCEGVPDLLEVEANLRAHGGHELVGGLDGLLELATAPAYVGRLSVHTRGIARASQQRVMLAEAEGIASRLRSDELLQDGDAWDAFMGEALARLEAMTRSGRGVATISMADAAQLLVQRWNEHLDGKTKVVRTGLRQFDRMLGGGLHPGRLYVVAGRPGMGKTTWAQSISRAITLSRVPRVDPPRWQARAGAPLVLWASGEMDVEQICRRMLSDLGTVDTRAVDSPSREWLAAHGGHLGEVLDVLASTNVQFLTDALSCVLDAIEGAVWMWRARLGPDALIVVIVDYLQRLFTRLRSKWSGEEERVSSLVMRCKNLARDARVPLILLSQLNRDCEKRENKRPILADLRSTGAIEQEADFVGGLYRDHYYRPDAQTMTDRVAALEHLQATGAVLTEAERTELAEAQRITRGAELIGLKNRQGPIGTVPLEFYGRFARYAEPTSPRSEST